MIDPNSNDVRQTLKDAQEYLIYLGELGVEHVDPPTPADVRVHPTTIVTEVTEQPSLRRGEYARAEATSVTTQPLAKPAPASTTPAQLPQTSLFGDAEVTVPALAQSAESLE